MNSRILEIESCGKLVAGKNDLLKHLSGKRLTQRQGIQAFCYECQGYCSDGREECQREECPLHPFSQFNSNRKKIRTRQPKEHPQE